MLALLAFQRRQLAAPVRILCRHTICSLWVATPQPPFGCCISLYRSDYLLTLSRPSHFHPLGCTLLRSGFPRRFDSRYTFKNVLLALQWRDFQASHSSFARCCLVLIYKGFTVFTRFIPLGNGVFYPASGCPAWRSCRASRTGTSVEYFQYPYPFCWRSLIPSVSRYLLGE